jgi:general secretion pathway protein L
MDFQTPIPQEDGGAVAAAAAVRTETLEEIVATYDGSGFPVHVVDVAPFAYARGLREKLGDGLLASVGTHETTLALVRNGRVGDFRVIPGALGADEAARVLLREGASLQRDAGMRNLPLFLIGPGATDALAEELRGSGRKVQIPLLYSGGREMPAEFLPAAALALRAALSGKEKEFNFRQGKYALKNEWTALRRELIAAAAVLVVTLAIFGVSAWLNYHQKSKRLEALDKQILQTYQQTFPGSRAKGDIPTLMQSSIKQLRERARLIGTGPEGSTLTVLDEISRRMPQAVKVDVRDMSFTPEAVRMEGVTTSFDAINQIARSLQESPVFAEAQIADAKASIDGSRVDFRLNLTYGKGG